MGRTKKICLFVVEGIADESSLALPLQNIFDTYYKQKGIEFQVTHGCLLYTSPSPRDTR